MDDDLKQPREELTSEEEAPQDEEARSRPLLQIIGIILIALAVILGVYGTVAFLAWQRSQEIQSENARSSLLEEIDEQLALAREDLAADNLSLAQRRLEWILQNEPDHPEALTLKSEIEQQLGAPTPTPRPTPTRPATAEEEGSAYDDSVRAFSRLEDLIEQARWAEAISAIVTFQSQQPNYRRQDTDRMLYESYISLGQELLPGEQVELGISYLGQAALLGDLPQEVEDQRLWAELYLQGIAYYGVDWGTAIYFFRDLCAAAPFYQDSCQKLRHAVIAHADGYAANLDWCPAEALYFEATQLNRDEQLSEKLTSARQQCLEATPTPSAPITGTVGISRTLPSTPAEAAGENDGGQ
ncbi:MAG: hypothetical protein JSW55_07885 [Chloroflexota bacterium]|nr:MAG: hypothetical protein JSW55_07885 [Chloroflexota bacterium]